MTTPAFLYRHPLEQQSGKGRWVRGFGEDVLETSLPQLCIYLHEERDWAMTLNGPHPRLQASLGIPEWFFTDLKINEILCCIVSGALQEVGLCLLF